MKKELRGQVALVTGGSKGIGFGIAHALAKEGATIVGTARTEKDLAELEKQVTALGGKALSYKKLLADYSAAAFCSGVVEAAPGVVPSRVT